MGTLAFGCKATDTSGTWRVEVLPNADDFVFQIRFAVNNNTLGNFYGIASYGRVFAVYYGSAAFYTAQLSMSSGSLNDIKFALYGPFNSLTVSGGNPTLPISVGLMQSSISFWASSNSYYYIVVKPKATIYAQASLIRLIYSTDIYACPYLDGSTDYNSAFQGCRVNSPTKGYPCLTNDFNTGYCTSCVSPYKPNAVGVCLTDISCPEGQYYHYGKC